MNVKFTRFGCGLSFLPLAVLRAVWFVAKRATLCLRLFVRIEELTLGSKSVAKWGKLVIKPNRPLLSIHR
jgi:hypothetical protein